MKRPLDTAIGTANLLTSLFFVLVCFKGVQDIVARDPSDSLEGKVIGLIFCLAVVILTAYAAWKKLYRNRHIAKQQSRDEKLHQIIHLAHQRKGEISALEAAMDTGLEIEESKELLEYLVDKGLAVMNVNEHAAIIFNFPDLKTAEPMPSKQITHSNPPIKQKELE